MNMSDWKELKEQVIDRELCCLCGTCIGMCPAGTLAYTDGRIENTKDRCIRCGRCVASCPGAGFDYPRANEELFGADESKIDQDIGYYRKILKGYATEPEIRAGASSGGIATALGCYMLQRGEVDYVIGVTGKRWEYEARALSTRAEVLEAMQSKYVFVPVNSVIRFILEHEGRYLYIGLPCQIQGLRKAGQTDARLRERVRLVAGIFCGFNMTHEATDWLIKKSGIPREEIERIEYRGNRGNETGFKISSASKEFFIPKHGYTLLNAFYSRERCWKCYDLTAEFADISFGDAWEMGTGWSRILCRTEEGERIIEQMIAEKVLASQTSCAQDVREASRKIIAYKKRTIGIRQMRLKSFPDYHTPLPIPGGTVKAKAEIFLLCLRFGKTRVARALLSILPARVLELLSRLMRKGTLQEALRYAIGGVGTTLIDFFSYWLFLAIGLNYQVSNIVAMVLTKTSAYLINKFFVFHSKRKSGNELLKEIGLFILTRGLSGVVEHLGLILLVDMVHTGKLFGKAAMIVVITILNYFFGKSIVFKKSVNHRREEKQ